MRYAELLAALFAWWVSGACLMCARSLFLYDTLVYNLSNYKMHLELILAKW